MKTPIYFQPGKPITLYNYRVDPQIQGSLLINDLLSLSENKEFVKNDTKVLSRVEILNELLDGFQNLFSQLIAKVTFPLPSKTIAFRMEMVLVGKLYKRWFLKIGNFLKVKIIFLEKAIITDFQSFSASFTGVSIPTLPANYLRKASIFLLFLSLLGFLYVVSPFVIGEIHAWPFFQSHSNLDERISGRIAQVYQRPLSPQTPVNIHDFRLIIPKIGLNSPVIPEVDPANEQIYDQALKKGVAQAKGSYLPGDLAGPTFLFSHSTDSISDITEYNAKFFFLKDLKVGDNIYISFEGHQYHYRITDRQIINPNNLGVIRNSKANLILSTCYPPGTDWQRLILSAILLPTY